MRARFTSVLLNPLSELLWENIFAFKFKKIEQVTSLIIALNITNFQIE